MSIENRKFSKTIKAGKRTYFIDIESNKTDSRKYFSITESKSTSIGFERQELKIYIEDVNNFVQGLNEAIDYYNFISSPKRVTGKIEQQN